MADATPVYADRLRYLEERLQPSTPIADWTHINTGEPGGLEALGAFGVSITGPACAERHDFFLKTPSELSDRLAIFVDRSEACLFVVEEPQHLSMTMVVIGSRNTFAAVGAPNMPGAIVLRGECHGEGNRILWGAGATSNGARIIAQGGQTVDVGADCMFADGITVRTTDNHAIFDAESGEVLNPTRDVVIGPHVWIGQEVAVSKGVTIGAGSVVGARSLVTKSLPAGVLAHGSPATIARRRVGWTRTLYPVEADKRAALDLTTLRPW